MSSNPAISQEMPILPNNHPLSPDESRFWIHFVNVVSGIITLPYETPSSNAHHDPISAHIILTSQTDTLVLNCILCLGASHLTNTVPTDCETTQALVRSKLDLLARAKAQLHTRASAFKSSCEQFTDNMHVECEVLVTAYMLLYFYHLSEGEDEGSSWRTCLNQAKGVIHILLHRGQKQLYLQTGLQATCGGDTTTCEYRSDAISRESIDSSLAIDKSVMRMFVYHDIFAGLVDDSQFQLDSDHSNNNNSSSSAVHAWDSISRTLLSSSYFSDTDNAWNLHRLLQLIPRVHALQLDAQASTAQSNTIIPRAAHLWQELVDWPAPAPPESESESESECSTNLHEAYVIALSLWIFCIIHPDDISSAKVQSMVQRGIGCLMLAGEGEGKDGSGVLRASLFPLFIIGVCAVTMADRDEMEGLFERVEELRGLRYIRVCVECIRRAWQRYDSGEGRSWDWRGLIWGSPGLVLA
ncbi:fungal-specific transcription factor domain-containing protein [Aspergillus heterothallicus]